MMPTLWFLATVVALTLVAFLAHLLHRSRCEQRLRRLAGAWQMNYSQHDRFNLTPRVLERFPVPGAADVIVADVIYGMHADRYRYCFTIEYTEGVILNKRRARLVGALTELHDHSDPHAWSDLVLAPGGLPLMEQYARLRVEG